MPVTEGNDLLAIGLAGFGVTYFFTSLAGAIIIDEARDDENARRINYGRALLVPVAGPFIAVAFTDSAKQRWGSVFSGSLQLTTAVLGIVGLVRKGRARRAQRYAVGGGLTSGGAVLSLSGRF